ncbi:MAG: F0F1 ATP synthase subunit A [Chloroflexota bacterium]|jgi:F-type H+-transporting ATPase subunit a
MKKRYILLLVFVGLIIFGSVIAFTRPVLPVIQLPGECYPGTRGLPIFNCLTNTFVTTILAWLIVFILVLSLRARSRTADEIPTGFYNFFELLIESGLNFATNIGDRKKAKHLFPLFFTLILYILVSNWIELVPGVDSIGFYEWFPHLRAVEEAAEVERIAAINDVEISEEQLAEFEHEAEELSDELNEGDFRVDPFLIKAPDNAIPGDVDPEDPRAGRDPENADWAIVAFFRAPATDLNFTLALALVTMVYVQIVGLQYLGIGYLKKFIPWNVSMDVMAKNPLKSIDWAVGLLELVGEISRIISFSFRLLGNIFAGQILLFVMAFLVPVVSVVFFGLELFVGLIQAVVFGLLALMFMAGASEHHGDDEDH